MVKIGTTVSGYYSRDGSDNSWQLIYTRTGVTWATSSGLRVGFYCAAGSGTAGPEIRFEDFKLNGQPVLFTQNILEFDTNPAWTIVRNDPTLVRVKNPTTLTLGGDNGELYGSGGSTKNVYLTPPQESNFTIISKLTFKGTANYHIAGIIAYADDDNYFAVARRYHSSYGSSTNRNIFAVLNEVNGSCSENNWSYDTLSSVCYLKIEKIGNTFSGYFSADGETWTLVSTGGNGVGSFSNNPNLYNSPNLKVGVFTAKGGSSSAATLDASFENFTINGVAIPFGSGNYVQDDIKGFNKAFMTNGDNLSVGKQFDISVFMRSENAVNADVLLAEYNTDFRLVKLSSATNTAVLAKQPFVSVDLSTTPSAKGWIRALIWENGTFRPLTGDTVWKVN